MSQAQFETEVSREEWEEQQAALPPHKREGYAEMMYEMADMRRKAEREEALLDELMGQPLDSDFMRGIKHAQK